MKIDFSHPAALTAVSCHEANKFKSRNAAAFTLVEMLVVISIITILLTVGALGLRNLSKGAGVSAGVPIAESLFAEARAKAVGSGARTRLLVHAENNRNDELDRERFLRYMAIASEELDSDGNPTGSWKIKSKGVTLPEGVFFVRSLSETDAPAMETMQIALPGGDTAQKNCFYYEFNAEGLITKPEITGSSVPRFVVRAGALPPGADEPLATSDGKRNIGGFVIWRSGRTSVFRHPDQIE